MTKGSFEKKWKIALQEAEEDIPFDLWEKIECELDKDKSMEVHLRHTLTHASVAPPEHLWNTIETKLHNNPEKQFISTSINKRVVSGIAALLLLALGFGLYQLDFSKAGNRDTVVLKKESVVEKKRQTSQSYQKENQVLTTELDPITDLNLSVKRKINSSKRTFSQTTEEKHHIQEAMVKSFDAIFLSKSNEEIYPANHIALIAKRSFDEFGNSFILKRNKLVYETPEELAEDKRGFFQRSWLSLVSGFSPFNPNVKINNFERAALASASNTPGSTFSFNSLAESINNTGKPKFAIPILEPYNEVQRGTAVNLGANYGKRIGKFLAIESGIRYTAGRSMLASNVYSYNEFTGSVKTFMESHYIRQEKTVFNNTVISSRTAIDNDYKFLNIPVQIGFYVPLNNRFEAAVTTGFSGDFIISNVLDNTPEGGSRLTASNSAYKAVNFSGIGSVRLNYAVQDNWQVSVGSSVQQTLTTGIDRSEGLSFRPRYVGLYTSLNYRFK
jgi:hypothetical protein